MLWPQFLSKRIIRPTAWTAALTCGLLMASLSHADDFRTRITQTLPVRGSQLPYSASILLTEVSPTRLGLHVLLDLRHLQRNAPAILSTVLDETCQHKYAVAVADATADGSTITVRGQFQAKFFTCDTSDPKVHRRTSLMLGQNLNVVATASAAVKGQCLHFRLNDLQLDLVGLIGDVAEVTGLTEKAQTLIIDKSNEVFASRPVCPKLPPELAALDPAYYSGGTTEIGDGGVGAYLKGSVDVSAATLLGLVDLMIKKDILAGVQ